jgi:hypothetical protein
MTYIQQKINFLKQKKILDFSFFQKIFCFGTDFQKWFFCFGLKKSVKTARKDDF